MVKIVIYPEFGIGHEPRGIDLSRTFVSCCILLAASSAEYHCIRATVAVLLIRTTAVLSVPAAVWNSPLTYYVALLIRQPSLGCSCCCEFDGRYGLF